MVGRFVVHALRTSFFALLVSYAAFCVPGFSGIVLGFGVCLTYLLYVRLCRIETVISESGRSELLEREEHPMLYILVLTVLVGLAIGAGYMGRSRFRVEGYPEAAAERNTERLEKAVAEVRVAIDEMREVETERGRQEAVRQTVLQAEYRQMVEAWQGVENRLGELVEEMRQWRDAQQHDR